MPFGIFVPVVRRNVTFAEEAGLDEIVTGDWKQFAELMKDYSAETEGRFGTAYSADADLPFEGWLRQHGEQLWSEDGKIGYSQDGLEAGATPEIGQQDGVSASWEDAGDLCLTWFGNSNHIVDDATFFPDFDFALEHLPVAAEAEDGHQFLYFPRMAIYKDTSDEKASLAGEVLSFCTANVETQKLTGLTMGAPVNPRVTEEYREFATEDETSMLDIVTADRERDRRPRYEAPPGSNTWRQIMVRVLEEITLGSTSISKGAASMIEQVTTGIDRAAS